MITLNPDFVEGVAAASVVGIAFFGAYFGLRPLLNHFARRSAAAKESAPLPAHWLTLLAESVPAVQHLTIPQRIGLLRSARELIDTRHWEGCGGLNLTPDMTFIIAAQACLLTQAIPGEPFPDLREVLVYPSTFVSDRVCDPRKWLTANAPKHPLPELGEAWGNGIIVIAWDAALAGVRDAHDGRNVVFHEFAHELAYEHRLAPKALLLEEALFGKKEVPLPDVPQPEKWRRVLEEAFENLCFKAEHNTPSAIGKYGATNLAEFFAVSAETFFEKPRELAKEYPELYEQLRSFFRQDPAGQAAA